MTAATFGKGPRANLTRGPNQGATHRAGRRPLLRKALGQHHLRSGTLCRPLLDFLAPLAGARVVEIGPGGGALTVELLNAGARLLAWELDVAWAATLRRRLSESKRGDLVVDSAPSLAPPESPVSERLSLVVGDALALPWWRLPVPTVVTGNLPYAIGTALVERLLPQAAIVPRAAFLLQLEVVQRLVARPGDPAHGALSVLTALRAEARLLGLVRPGSFRPPPKVDSAFVGLELHPPPLPEAEMPAITALVRAAFAQPRKTLRNNLGAAFGFPTATALLAAAAIDPRTRAERLGVQDFLRLYGEMVAMGISARS